MLRSSIPLSLCGAGVSTYAWACCAFSALVAVRRRSLHNRALDHAPRTVVIGDVHGCVDELRKLLSKCDFRSGLDRLILVGDLVAKGPDSGGVIDLARSLGAEGVLGNHDYNVLTYYDKRPTKFPSREHENIAKSLTAAQAAYIRSLPLLLEVPEHNTIIVHAGVMPGCRPSDTPANYLMNLRGVNEDGSPSFSAHVGTAWAKLWQGPEHIVFGHDAIRKLQREQFATGLDTACCYGGELTALILPRWQLVTVKAARCYADV